MYDTENLKHRSTQRSTTPINQIEMPANLVFHLDPQDSQHLIRRYRKIEFHRSYDRKFDNTLHNEDTLFQAERLAHGLPENLLRKLFHLAKRNSENCSLLIKGLPTSSIVSEISFGYEKPDRFSEHILLGVAGLLGNPYGYTQHRHDDIVQDVLPLPQQSNRQTSLSSSTSLDLYTETSLRQFPPDFQLLFCLRPAPLLEAQTILVDLSDVLDKLSDSTKQRLFEKRYTIKTDQSCLDNNQTQKEILFAVLSGNTENPTVTYDQDFIQGLDQSSQQALDLFSDAVLKSRKSIKLRQGDLLIFDNKRSIHGRSTFKVFYQGRDRWLQRTHTINDLHQSSQL